MPSQDRGLDAIKLGEFSYLISVSSRHKDHIVSFSKFFDNGSKKRNMGELSKSTQIFLLLGLGVEAACNLRSEVRTVLTEVTISTLGFVSVSIYFPLDL